MRRYKVNDMVTHMYAAEDISTKDHLLVWYDFVSLDYGFYKNRMYCLAIIPENDERTIDEKQSLYSEKPISFDEFKKTIYFNRLDKADLKYFQKRYNDYTVKNNKKKTISTTISVDIKTSWNILSKRTQTKYLNIIHTAIENAIDEDLNGVNHITQIESIELTTRA